MKEQWIKLEDGTRFLIDIKGNIYRDGWQQGTAKRVRLILRRWLQYRRDVEAGKQGKRFFTPSNDLDRSNMYPVTFWGPEDGFDVSVGCKTLTGEEMMNLVKLYKVKLNTKRK